MQRQQVLLALPAAAAASSLGWLVRSRVRASLRLAVTNWRHDPKSQTIDAAISLVYGQGVMWTVGQDFIGLAMNPKWRPGLGHKVAAAVAARLPITPLVCWTFKVVELASDASKIPLEGRVMQRTNAVPDIVAFVVTQPLWSYIEVVEKLVGLVRFPQRVVDRAQLEDSISSIYGTWTRNLAGLVLISLAPKWHHWLRRKLFRSEIREV